MDEVWLQELDEKGAPVGKGRRFVGGRWIQGDIEGSQNPVQLNEDVHPAPLVPHLIDVHTGAMQGAGTNGDVYVSVEYKALVRSDNNCGAALRSLRVMSAGVPQVRTHAGHARTRAPHQKACDYAVPVLPERRCELHVQGEAKERRSADVQLPAQPGSFRRGAHDHFTINLPDAAITRVHVRIEALAGSEAAPPMSFSAGDTMKATDGVDVPGRSELWHLQWIAIQPASSAQRPNKVFYPCFDWLGQVGGLGLLGVHDGLCVCMLDQGVVACSVRA